MSRLGVSSKTVNVQQLSHQLTREIKRNPAKAAVLGGLLVVAVWFWFPLVKGWIGLSGSADDSHESIVVATPAQPDSTASSNSSSAPIGKANWRTIARRMSEDTLMQTGQLRSETFDPFYPEQPLETQFTATDTPPETAPIPDVSPETAGLTITSVIVGGAVPIARINNLNYHVGDQVTAQDGQLQYTVVAVKPWGVLLQGPHQTYELHLEQVAPKSGHRVVMRNGTVISSDN